MSETRKNILTMDTPGRGVACYARGPGTRKVSLRQSTRNQRSGQDAERVALTHYNVFSSPALASAVTPFLDAPMPGAK